MTVTNTTNKVSYAGDDATSAFPFAFKAYVDTDLEVVLINDSTSVETTLVLNTNYTIAFTNAVKPSAGTVTLTGANSPLATGFTLVIRRILPFTQEIDLVDNEGTPAATYEEGYDRGVMLIQQMKEEIDRALKQAVTATTSLEIPTPEANKVLTGVSATEVAWSALSTTTYAGTIGRGADASKAASPSVGDIYFATDTGKIYICAVAGVWIQMTTVTDQIKLAITQATHGFSVGDVLKFSGGVWAKAQADSEANQRVLGVVGAVDDVNNFDVIIGGEISGLSGLTAGSRYYLDPSTAGAATTTKPSTAGQFIKDVYIATSTTEAIVNVGYGDEVVASATVAMPTGYLDGGVPSNNASDATNDIDFTACNCRDSADGDNIAVAAMTKQIDAVWAAGSAAGMLDTGTIGASPVLIAFFAIDDSNAVNAGDFIATKADPSTGPSMPAGYDIKRYLGSRKWSGTAWVEFLTTGSGRDRWTEFGDPDSHQVLTSGSASSFTDVDCSAVVAAKDQGGAVGRVVLVCRTGGGGGAGPILYIRYNGASGTQANGNSVANIGAGAGPHTQSLAEVAVDDGAIFEYEHSGTGDSNIWIRSFLENL